ncbi:MAG: cytidine deaminase [Nanoarchaeota archaeon]|nr:cytidine deaminase [Nanoarchaeota archaeon]
MAQITNERLIKEAESVVKPTKIGDYLVGDVGCALVTDKGNIFRGVCIDTCSGMGFCAEHSAIAAMVTAGEFKIRKLVGVWKDDKGITHVLPPCGRCREFIRQIHKENLETDIILGKDKVVKLKELLPYHDWFK